MKYQRSSLRPNFTQKQKGLMFTRRFAMLIVSRWLLVVTSGFVRALRVPRQLVAGRDCTCRLALRIRHYQGDDKRVGNLSQTELHLNYTIIAPTRFTCALGSVRWAMRNVVSRREPTHRAAADWSALPDTWATFPKDRAAYQAGCGAKGATAPANLDLNGSMHRGYRHLRWAARYN